MSARSVLWRRGRRRYAKYARGLGGTAGGLNLCKPLTTIMFRGEGGAAMGRGDEGHGKREREKGNR